LEPFRVGGLVEMAAAAAVDERRVGRRIGIRVQRLQRIDQDACDVPALAQYTQRMFGHFAQGQRVGGWLGVADAWLHVAPPAVIGAAETDKPAPAGVIACEPYR